VLGASQDMKTELATPTQHKTIKMSLDQYSVSRVAITTFIKSLKEKEMFFLERLNTPSLGDGIKNNQFFLKMCREQITDLEKLVKIMDKAELITEHKLY
tara:strand:- start:301 stop:597 length:297 start_codon:yes stop_codon:yes gene_type:complete